VTHIEIESAELGLMLEGIDLAKAVRHKRWRPESPGDDAHRSP